MYSLDTMLAPFSCHINSNNSENGDKVVNTDFGTRDAEECVCVGHVNIPGVENKGNSAEQAEVQSLAVWEAETMLGCKCLCLWCRCPHHG